MRYTFYSRWGQIFLQAGIDLALVLRLAHLPEDLLRRTDIMLTEEEYFALMEQAGRIADKDAAITIATCGDIEAYSPPVFAALQSENGRALLSRLAQYKRLVGPLRLIVTQQADTIQMEVCPLTVGRSVPAFWVEMEMAFVLNLLRKATRTNIRPLCVTMQHKADTSSLAAFLGCQPLKGDRNVLTLSLADASLPFITHNDAMWQYIEPELRRRLSEMESDDSVASRVRSALVELLPAGKTTVDDVAGKLCMSRRTLQRKLTDEHTTFLRQLCSTRLLLAQNYLRDASHTNADIAFLLGYEDTASFLRAFSTWTGKTVGEYRRSSKSGNAL